MTSLNFPKISNDEGIIKEEYRKSYNRELTLTDISNMRILCQKKELQKLIDNYNIRNIDVDYKELVDLFNDFAESQNLEVFKFYYEKINYDGKFWILRKMKKLIFTNDLQKYIDIQVVKLIDTGDYANTLRKKYPELLPYCIKDK